ncbi:DNA recombination protein RmuC [Pelagibius litoralis]|uniref:DNA recombination protein RmuC homolog n=1 Tax=Pelagibius litoralis TaxID=374515 RepID=A0A967KBU5_9PROT|nr:DNA recombination protein RmuC [Pelagibius litoralis]NIA71292.1 DNA recombination protein RmuC [Pelagibius litoralis]
MDSLIIAAAVVGCALSIVLGLFLFASRRSQDGDQVAALTGRLAQMADSQAAAQARVAEHLQAQERLLAKAMDERLEGFSKRVGEHLTETSTKSHTALTDLRERLAVIDKAQQNLAELSGQMVGLQDILANKQARGAFGEVQLRDLVEAALPPSAYAFQATLKNGRRPDCLLQLPNPPGSIAIDAKFPLESYEALRAAGNDEALLAPARRSFATDLRRHVQDIAARYILPGETAESALLFLPSEAVYAELHANFRGVVEESYKARVWIVSPTTLMATLNTVRAVLKDVRMREQAGIIQGEVGKMMEDVGRLDKRVNNLEAHFEHARRDIQEIRTSSGKILRRGEKIGELELEEAEAEAALEPASPAPAQITTH